MASQRDRGSLPFARPLPDSRQPQRETLRLADGYETSVYVHRRPACPQRLPVLHVHGIQSHPGWFVGSAADLADRGHTVFQVTRRGSGDNVFARGHAASAPQLLDDVDVACRFVLRQMEAAAVHLLGVSWGGKLLAAYAAGARRGVEVASLTLVAPGLAPRVDVPATTKLAIALALLAAPRRQFEIPLGDVQLFTDNGAMRQYLRDDRYRLHRATASFLYASRCLDRLLRRAPAGCLRMPTTLLLAGRDRIIDNAGTQALAAALAGERLQVREFDAAHTIEFEPDPRGFYDALAAAVARGQ